MHFKITWQDGQQVNTTEFILRVFWQETFIWIVPRSAPTIIDRVFSFSPWAVQWAVSVKILMCLMYPIPAKSCFTLGAQLEA